MGCTRSNTGSLEASSTRRVVVVRARNTIQRALVDAHGDKAKQPVRNVLAHRDEATRSCVSVRSFIEL